MTIYALFHETNGDDGQIEALYLHEADANAARLAALRAARAAGMRVYWDPDTGEDCADWDHNWRVDAEVVQTAPPDVVCTADGCGSVSRRAQETDAINALQCGACLRVGTMVPAQTAPGAAEAAETYAPNPIAVVLAGMLDTLNGTAASLQREEMIEHARTLAAALGVSVTIDEHQTRIDRLAVMVARSSEPCEECGEAIPGTAPSLINEHHDQSCSLYEPAGHAPVMREAQS